MTHLIKRDAQVHTRTEPIAKEGLRVWAGEAPLSDFFTVLGLAAYDTEKVSQIKAILYGAASPVQEVSDGPGLVLDVAGGAAPLVETAPDPVELAFAYTDPALQADGNEEMLRAALEKYPYPIRDIAGYERFEDTLFDDVERVEIEEANQSAARHKMDLLGRTQEVGFNDATAAAQVARVRAKHAKDRQAREHFRRERRALLARVLPALLPATPPKSQRIDRVIRVIESPALPAARSLSGSSRTPGGDDS